MKRYYIWVILAGALLMSPLSTWAATSALHIHAFQIAGENAYDEFVSISNDGSSSIDLTNYSISRKSKTATSWNTLHKFTGVTIYPGQVIVVANAKYIGISNYLYSTSSYSLTTDNSVAIIAPDKSIMDLAGYGEANTFEGSPLSNPAAGEQLVRTQDTNVNSDDFVSSFKVATLDPNADKVMISELMPAPSEGKEWFELFNPTSLLVSLSGIKICDAVGSVHCYYLPDTETLQPFQYKVYGQDTTKITLNNTGDWLELRDGNDNLLVDSGGDYGSADEGNSLSLFGSEFIWTKSATPGVQNIFTDTAEVEESVVTAAKSTSKKVKTTVAKVATTTAGSVSDKDEAAISAAPTNEKQAVKGASSKVGGNNQALGYALISLAVLLLFGYNLWENRGYASKLYDKIRYRND